MYQIGDYLVYGSEGVCEVTGVETLDLRSSNERRMYYILVPISNNGSKIYIPVDSDKVKLRTLIEKEEAHKLLTQASSLEDIWDSNDKLREVKYKEYLRHYSCKDYLIIFKSIYKEKQKRVGQGRKLTSTDEKYLKLAQDALCNELAITLGVPAKQVEEELISYIA